MKKIIRILSVILIMCIVFSLTAFAQESKIPYDTYTYWYSGGVAKTPTVTPIYEPDTVISKNSLGISSFGSLDDVFSDKKGTTFVLDGTNSVIYMLNNEYKIVSSIEAVTKGSEKLLFEGAKSVFVKGNLIYISDTQNERVLVCDLNGNFVDEYLKPKSSLIPKDFAYKPIKVSVDSYGYVYVLCDGSYYGAILFNDKHEFISFFGANSVKKGVLGSIQSAFSRMFVNNAKKSASATALPYVFSDLFVDDKNFVYTSTGYTKEARTGQIKKLNPGGSANVLASNDVNFADLKVNNSINIGKEFNQDFVSIEVDELGFIYALDSGHGKIFIYNQDCILLAAFGGGMHSGEQIGTFRAVNALTINGNDILVSDANKKTITVFGKTEFGEKLLKAGNLTDNGEYEAALPIWEEVISEDRNCNLAYSGIALALLQQEKYDEAMQYAKQGYSYEAYALAFKEIRDNWLEENFIWIMAVLLVAVVAFIAAAVYKKKKNIVLIKNQEVSMLFSVPFHPSKSFYKIQEKHIGSYWICLIVLLIFYVTSVLEYIAGGFAFTGFDPEGFNSIQFLIRTVGLVVLWIIVNWAVSAIFGGRGKIKEIAVVTCYSLTPMILSNILFIICSNVLIPEEAAFLSIASTVLQLFSILLILVGTMVIHDYDFKHFLGTTILTVIGIAIVVFLMIMVILLVQQVWFFASTVYNELTL